MRRKRAEGGPADDDDMTPMQQRQAALDHVATRGQDAIYRRTTGVDEFAGANTNKSPGGNDRDDEDAQNFRDEFGDAEAAGVEARARNLRANVKGDNLKAKGGRVRKKKDGQHVEGERAKRRLDRPKAKR